MHLLCRMQREIHAPRLCRMQLRAQRVICIYMRLWKKTSSATEAASGAGLLLFFLARAVITPLLSSQRAICIFIIGCTPVSFAFKWRAVAELLCGCRWKKCCGSACSVVIANLFGLKKTARRPQINSMALTGNNQNVINLRLDYSIHLSLRLRTDGMLIEYFHF